MSTATTPLEHRPGPEAVLFHPKPLLRAVDRLQAAARVVDGAELCERVGRVAGIVGPMLRVSGLQAALGHVVHIRSPHQAEPLLGEVAGFSDSTALVMPFGPIDGLGRDARVQTTGAPLMVPHGPGLLGCVIDPLGNVLRGQLGADCVRRPLSPAVPDPFERLTIDEQLFTGVRCLDTLVPLGQGQRMGVFAAAGCGKTTLLGMLARGCEADAIVIGLIGERGREVRDFIEHNLGEVGMRRSVVVVATSDRSALERIKCAFVATAVAEDLRDRGMRVLLLVDSLTRFARAQRELGLALGEPPTRRGYPPSLFAMLPRLLERSGRTHRGSISALYTVLMEDDSIVDPVAEEVKSLLDGHIHLSPKVSGRGIYPAVDIGASLSRLQSSLRKADQLRAAEKIRSLWTRYLNVELLIQMGEYKPGGDPATDEAVRKHPDLCEYLRQDEQQLLPAAQSDELMRRLAAG
jgi:type III secretion protein N (ATPase)